MTRGVLTVAGIASRIRAGDLSPAPAVAARMIPLALGSQTVGSLLRPAAYCGVVGLKPTHGRISAAGVVPLAWSLDHVGIFARWVEAAAFHRDRFARHRDAYRPKIRGLIEEGLAIPGVEYVRAQQARRTFREEVTPLFERYDALLMPVAPAPAPKGLTWTGDPGLCAPWSFSGLPAIALPSGLAADGLPLSIQLVTAPFTEDRLLGVARWCEATLDFTAAPRLEAISA